MAEVASLEAVLRLRDETSSGLRTASQRLRRVGGQMQSLGRGLTMGITLPLAAVSTLSVKAASDFESSFAGVRKTVEATEEQFAMLSQGIRDMANEIPTSVNELNRIAEAGGQLGVATENIVAFTRVIADMAVTTNLTADAAATAFARIANITGLSQDKFENLGSAVVALGNNLATTEAEISEFALRIAAAGTIAGLTEAEVLAIGAAMSSVGVRAERGGTAVQKVLTNMVQAVAEGGEKLGIFAEVTGQTATQFAHAFRTDAAGAFTSFVEGLGLQGEAAFNTLEDLELQDQRLIQSFLSLAGAGDLLRTSMALSSHAFDENTALAEEAEKRYATFASQLGVLKNKAQGLAIDLGTVLIPILQDLIEKAGPIIDWLKQAIVGFGDLDPPLQKIILGFAGLAFVAGPLAIGLSAILFVLPGLAAGITMVAGSVGVLGAALAPILVPLLAVAAVLAAVGIAWKLGFGMVKGLQTEAAEAMDHLKERAQELNAVGAGIDLALPYNDLVRAIFAAEERLGTLADKYREMSEAADANRLSVEAVMKAVEEKEKAQLKAVNNRIAAAASALRQEQENAAVSLAMATSYEAARLKMALARIDQALAAEKSALDILAARHEAFLGRERARETQRLQDALARVVATVEAEKNALDDIQQAKEKAVEDAIKLAEKEAAAVLKIKQQAAQASAKAARDLATKHAMSGAYGAALSGTPEGRIIDLQERARATKALLEGDLGFERVAVERSLERILLQLSRAQQALARYNWLRGFDRNAGAAAMEMFNKIVPITPPLFGGITQKELDKHAKLRADEEAADLALITSAPGGAASGGNGAGAGITVVVNVNGDNFGFEELDDAVAAAVTRGLIEGKYSGTLTPG